MLPPRIKIATDILRALAKSLEQFYRHHIQSRPLFYQHPDKKKHLFQSLKQSLMAQTIRQVHHHSLDLEISTEDAPCIDAKHSSHQAPLRRWMIEPISGINNFFTGYSDYALRLSELQGEQFLFSLIYFPKLDELYCAERGYGVRLNQHRLQVHRSISPRDHWLIGAPSQHEQLLACLKHFQWFCQKRHVPNTLEFQTGSELMHHIAALCSHRLDVCWSGELEGFTKKLVAFWMKEAALRREVLQSAEDNPHRTWIFGNFPTLSPLM